MKRYNQKLFIPLVFAITAIFGVGALLFSGWVCVGVILCTGAFIYINNRSSNIDHYCVGVDLDTNPHGDIIEIGIYAFDKTKNLYYPITTYFKQLRVYISIPALDNFYTNIGYPITDYPALLIRKVWESDTQELKTAKKFHKRMIANVNQNYKYSAGSLLVNNAAQPRNKNITTRNGVIGKLWSWWTFKTNN